jgi:RNA polymerase sigma factor (sigma-70 family)
MATTLHPRIAHCPRALLALALASAGEGATAAEHPLDALVIACQSGEPHAFDRLVRAIEAPLLRLATAILHDAVAAEDAFVEAMARVLPRIGELDAPGAFSTYARRAVRNAAVDLRRSRSHRDARRALVQSEGLRRARPDDPTPLTDRLPSPAPNPERAVLAAEQRRRVQAAVEDLKEPGRSVVRLRFEGGLTLDEIAARTGLSRTGVKRQLAAARVALAARLQREGEGA